MDDKVKEGGYWQVTIGPHSAPFGNFSRKETQFL